MVVSAWINAVFLKIFDVHEVFVLENKETKNLSKLNHPALTKPEKLTLIEGYSIHQQRLQSKLPNTIINNWKAILATNIIRTFNQINENSKQRLL